MDVELTYCVVNTEQRQLLSYCLDAIARERATVDFETETLVLDNASRDGSAEAARAHAVTTEVIALDRRRGRGENTTELVRRARGRFCLILNEDSELEPGATAALHAALSARRQRRGRRRHARAARRRAAAVRVALPEPVDGPAVADRARPPVRRAEPRRARSATSTGRRWRRCWCGARRPRASNGPTATRWASAAACGRPAGACCTCPRRAPSTTSTDERPLRRDRAARHAARAVLRPRLRVRDHARDGPDGA